MSISLKVSAKGLKIVDQARSKMRWSKTDVAWQVKADVSKSTLNRFWMQKPIKNENFVAICVAVGVEDWEQVADSPQVALQSTVQNNPRLEEFKNQIYYWFQALEFEFEDSFRAEANCVEWVIRVPVRSRFDRVLVRAITHEAGLGDLGGLSQSVKDLRVDEGWLVTSLWVSQSVKQALNMSDEKNLTCLTFDELIDQDANFAPYLTWLEQEIQKREIDRYYVQLGCTKGEFNDGKYWIGTSDYPVEQGGIDLYVDRWLENPVNEHVSILGEFGTGKTWFVLHYAGKCLQAYVEAKQKGLPRPRLPLVILLRDYAKALSVENVLADFFYTRHNIRLSSAVFDQLNRMGKLLLIFDGFDEMANKVSEQQVIDNFWELAKVVTINAKVILTCRTEHFPTAQSGRATLRGELMASIDYLAGKPPQFETLELMRFDNVQIREVLRKRTNEVTVNRIINSKDLLDLLQRAVMIEIILEALPKIESEGQIDLARAYLYAVHEKMQRDITEKRTFTSLADKLYFMCELSWEMLSTDRLILNYQDFPKKLKELFGNKPDEQKKLDHWHYDMMGQTMLIRNNDGDYSFAHKSLAEFFTAYKFAAELGLLAPDFLGMAQEQSGIDADQQPHNYSWSTYWKREFNIDGKPNLITYLADFSSESPGYLKHTFGKFKLSKAMRDLFLPMLKVDTAKKILLDLVVFTKNKLEVGYLGGNAVTALVEIDDDSLSGKNLSRTNLVGADLFHAKFRKTNLNGANLQGASLSKTFGPINVILMINNKQQFVTAHDDNIIRIWNQGDGAEIVKLHDHKEQVCDMLLSREGKSLYSCSQDRTIKKWDLFGGTNETIFELKNGEKNKAYAKVIALSSDEKFLCFGDSDGLLTKLDIENNFSTFQVGKHAEGVNAIIISPDNKLLYSGGNEEYIKIWDVEKGALRFELKSNLSWINTISLSPCGKFLYVGGGNKSNLENSESEVEQWDIMEMHCVGTFKGHESWVNKIITNLDGSFIYSCDNNGFIRSWATSNRECHRNIKAHNSWVNSISLNIDGELLYSGGNDLEIKVWDLESGNCKDKFDGYKGLIRTIAVTNSGGSIYSGSHNCILKEWMPNGHRKSKYKGHESWIRKIILSSDEQFLYSGSDDHTIKIWNTVTGECEKTLKGHQGSVRTMVLSPNESLLYSGSDDHTIKIWNTNTGECQQTLRGHQDAVRSIVLNSDGTFLYSGSDDYSIKAWRTSDGELVDSREKTHKESVRSLVISSDNNFLYSGSADRTIQKWRINNDNGCTLDWEKIINGNYESVINTIVLGANNESLYVGGSDENIRQLKISDGKCIKTFTGHQSSVNTIYLNPDRKNLYSGSDDRHIKVWDTKSGVCIHDIDTRIFAGAKIAHIKGLSESQKKDWIALGAMDSELDFELVDGSEIPSSDHISN
jgi:WD40 repeat protein